MAPCKPVAGLSKWYQDEVARLQGTVRLAEALLTVEEPVPPLADTQDMRLVEDIQDTLHMDCLDQLVDILGNLGSQDTEEDSLDSQVALRSLDNLDNQDIEEDSLDTQGSQGSLVEACRTLEEAFHKHHHLFWEIANEIACYLHGPHLFHHRHHLAYLISG